MYDLDDVQNILCIEYYASITIRHPPALGRIYRVIQSNTDSESAKSRKIGDISDISDISDHRNKMGRQGSSIVSQSTRRDACKTKGLFEPNEVKFFFGSEGPRLQERATRSCLEQKQRYGTCLPCTGALNWLHLIWQQVDSSG